MFYHKKCIIVFYNSICVIFNLGRQAILLRGDWKDTSASEFNSNFHQLNLMRAENDLEFELWIKNKKWKLTSPEIQNEIVEVCFRKHNNINSVY